VEQAESQAQRAEVTPLGRLELEALVQRDLRADREARNRAPVDRPDREQSGDALAFVGEATAVKGDEGQRRQLGRDQVDGATRLVAQSDRRREALPTDGALDDFAEADRRQRSKRTAHRHRSGAHDDVDIVMGARLPSQQCIDAPTSCQPRRHTGRVEYPKQVDDISGADHQESSPHQCGGPGTKRARRA
jgi:hypothetical protein